MKYLVYISTATHLLNQDELLDILETSRKNNNENNLTGILLYGEGVFIQVIEGNEGDLAKTYASIERDVRHHSIIKMTEGETIERNFPNWRMGFKSTNADELAEFSDFINPSQVGALTSSNSSGILSMLKTFVNNNRMSA